MRIINGFGIVAAATLVFSGCLADVLVSTAVQGELQAKQAQTAVQALNHAKASKSEIEINHAIQTFAAEKGRNPQSLDELVPTYLPGIPTKPDGSPYGYDPVSGTLSDAPVVAARPKGTNPQKIAQINQAITKYGMAVGYYPPTLDALVPAYIPSLPIGDSGSPFAYDNQTGKVWDPGAGSFSQPPPQQRPQSRPVAAGGSPVLGETMTGIGISNELNNMSSAGSSAAGSSARMGARAIGESHDAKQQKVMDELGF